MNIWIAASDGREDTVVQFLNNGFTAGSADENGYTPIHAAAAYGHRGLLKRLVTEFGGDINVRDGDGDTPLHHVEDMETAKLILEELGGDAALTNGEGKTALEVFEEDGEFAELIQYMRQHLDLPVTQDSVLGVKESDLAQFKDNLRFTLENDPVDENDAEAMARRKRLKEIIQGDNAEQELENYIREIVRFQMTDDDSSSKRQK